MATRSFGVKEINLVGPSSATPTIESPVNLNIIVGAGYSVGVGTTNPISKFEVQGGDIRVGINTSSGLILTSANGSKFRLIVDNSGNLSTVFVS